MPLKVLACFARVSSGRRVCDTAEVGILVSLLASLLLLVSGLCCSGLVQTGWNGLKGVTVDDPFFPP